MPSIFKLIRDFWLVSLLMAPSFSVPAQEEHRVGVLIEAIIPNRAADRAGLREGDLVQSWERGAAKGTIESPFGDLVKGEAYLSRALDIEEKLVPGNLDVARVLNNLGVVLGRFFAHGRLALEWFAYPDSRYVGSCAGRHCRT